MPDFSPLYVFHTLFRGYDRLVHEHTRKLMLTLIKEDVPYG